MSRLHSLGMGRPPFRKRHGIDTISPITSALDVMAEDIKSRTHRGVETYQGQVPNALRRGEDLMNSSAAMVAKSFATGREKNLSGSAKGYSFYGAYPWVKP